MPFIKIIRVEGGIMEVAEIFTLGFFGIIGLAIFMFFLLGIVDTICHRVKKSNERET